MASKSSYSLDVNESSSSSYSRFLSPRFLLIFLVVVSFVVVIVVVPVTLASRSASSSSISPISPAPSASPTAAPLITLNADAYTESVISLLQGFNASSGIPVAPVHPGGSFGLAAQIKSGGCQADVFLPVALSAASPSNLGSCSSQWAIAIGSDEMVIAYAPGNTTNATAAVVELFHTAVSSNANADWNAAFSNLTDGAVKLGISNPALDPAGLRGWLVLEAASYFYSGNNQSVYAAALLQSGSNVTGAAAESMIPLMEAGLFQFLFIYRSAAIDSGLPFLQLNHLVNLGDPTLGSTYSLFTYPLPTGINKGGPILLSMTIPAGAPHPSEAEAFVQYVVGSVASLATFGLKPLSPPWLYNSTNVPQFVATMLVQHKIVYGGRLSP